MSLLNDIATDVAVDYASRSGDKQAAFDDAVIYTIADMIIELINVLKDCRKGEDDAVEIMHRPGLFQRIRLRNVVKQQVGAKHFRKVGDEIVESLMKRGKKVTISEVKELYETV